MNRRNLLVLAAGIAIARPGAGAQAQATDTPVRLMLAMVPPRDALEEPPIQIASYVNMTTVLEASALNEFPDDDDDLSRFITVTSTVPIDSAIYMNMFQDWDSLIGFEPDDVTHLLVAFAAPWTVRVFLGRFDISDITDALEGRDYVKSTRGDFTLFASPTGDDLNLASDLDRLGPGQFNYLAVSRDVVITVGRKDMLDALPLGDSDAPSLADELAELPIVRQLESATGAYLLDGAFLSVDNLNLDLVNGVPTIPAADWFAGSVTWSGDAAASQFLVAFDGELPEDAVSIVSNRIEDGFSLITQQSYSEVMGQVDVVGDRSSGIVSIRGTAPEFAQRWMRMIQSYDLLFVATD
jgi:hypothetical protein